MPALHHIDRSDGIFLLVGTTKGLFVYAADRQGTRWEHGGPYFAGQSVYAAALDTRSGRHRLWAAPTSPFFGPGLVSSDDFGRNFTTPESRPIRFPEGTDQSLKQIWQIALPTDAPETIYAGVEPAALFVSHDAGASFALCQGLFDHPHRPKWQPGGGGLCLHTVVAQGQRLFVAISSGGAYRSDDGGATWQARNVGIRAGFLPPDQQFPEFGQCVHKLAPAAGQPNRYYLQHHGGVYRSDDAGDSWQRLTNGLPSDFGFPVVAHPVDADTFYVLPLEADMFRATPEARLRVYRSRDGGASFEPLANGLPQVDAYETVLRDGMTADATGGLALGTRSGKLFRSPDGGDSWHELANGLPPIVCVKAAVV